MLQLRNTTLAQVMVPIQDALSVSEHSSARAVERRSRESGHSRFPVMDVHGRFVGLVHIREAVRTTASGRHRIARELMAPALTLPATMPVANAVTAMRADRAQLALVSDTEDRVIGIAALEDLLEELIGDFEDETDTLLRTT